MVISTCESTSPVVERDAATAPRLIPFQLPDETLHLYIRSVLENIELPALLSVFDGPFTNNVHSNTSSTMYTSLSTEKREIRLLRIHPASDPSDDIRCTLATVSLQDGPNFDALSYVWGDANITETIFVDGKPFEATTNLVAGLREIRKASQSDPMWIDAICINQQNLEENNSQVPMMRDIYREAQTTLVWLGQAGEESRLAFQLLTRWVSAHEGSIEFMRNCKDLPRRKPRRTTETSGLDDLEELAKFAQLARTTTRDYMAAMLHSSFDSKEYDALFSFSVVPYWRRIWITQEFALSRRLVFIWGGNKLPYSTLSSGYRAMRNYEHLYGLGNVLSDDHILQINLCYFQRLEALIDLKERYANQHNVKYMSLFDLLNMNKQCMATHMADRVYGLLGLCDSARCRLTVDYSRPCNEIFQELTQTFLEDPTIGMDILCLTGGTNLGSVASDLASWVPNFANPGCFFDAQRDFFDWSDSGLCAEAVIYKSRLELNCIFRNEIKDIRRWSDDAETIFDDFEVWLNFALADAKLHPSGLPNLQVFFKTLIFDDLKQTPGYPVFGSKLQEMSFFGLAAGFMETVSKLFFKSLHQRSQPVPTSRHEWYHLLSPYMTDDESQLILDLNVPFVVRAFAWWLVTSPLKPHTITVTAVLEEFFGAEASGAYIQPNLDEYFGMGARMFEFVQQYLKPSQLRGDCFFKTKNAYMGIGPQQVAPGDLLCSVPGCKWPLVVRPKSSESGDDKEQFQVIGACYVYGMMHGEVAKDPEVEQKMRRVVFV